MSKSIPKMAVLFDNCYELNCNKSSFLILIFKTLVFLYRKWLSVLFVCAQVLQTGQEINEIDNTGFSTHQPTVYAGNLGNNRFVVQVTTISVKLLQGAVQLQHVPMDLGSPIVLVSRLVQWQFFFEVMVV